MENTHQILDRPLEQIRLLKSVGGPNDDPLPWLSFELSHHDMKSLPPYIAVSYEWGNCHRQRIIFVNGRPFLIRHNLYLLLCELAQKQRDHELSTDTRFWVDSICIDQSSRIERNAQVRIMGSIYGAAREVYAWLGLPPLRDPEFQRLEAWKARSGKRKRSPSRGHISFHARQRKSSGPNLLYVMAARSSYFKRRWIVQELFLASKIVLLWGKFSLDWGRFCDVLHKISQVLKRSTFFSKSGILQRLSPAYNIIDIYSQLDGNHRSGHPLVELLVAFRHLDCEIAHDRVYALRAIATDGSLINPDYDSTIEAVYYQVLQHCRWSWTPEVREMIAIEALKMRRLPLTGANRRSIAHATTVELNVQVTNL